jgi:hypothetical protein
VEKIELKYCEVTFLSNAPRRQITFYFRVPSLRPLVLLIIVVLMKRRILNNNGMILTQLNSSK